MVQLHQLVCDMFSLTDEHALRGPTHAISAGAVLDSLQALNMMQAG